MKKFASILLIVILTFTSEYVPITANIVDYCTIVNESNQYTETNPYETKRIIVYTDYLKNNYNAINSSFYYGAFTLEYNTEEDTANAYKNLIEDFGSENVVLDKILNLYSFNQDDYYDKELYQYFPNILSGNYPLIQDINNYSGNKKEILVGVIDTGLDTDTPFYSDRYIYDSCTSFISDTGLTNGDPEDLLGHGTSVCFAIANSSPDNVKIISYKIFDSEGNTSIDAIRNALYQAYEDNVDIINMSWGGDSTFSILERDLKTLYHANITMIAAAGNDGTETVNNVFPAGSNYTIAVSSISNEKVGNKYSFSYFSTYGSAITFSSPGEHISLVSNDEKIYYCSGTSFATPILAGQLATLKTFVTNTSKEEDVNLLKKYISSDFSSDYATNTNYKSNQYGYGYLDFSNTRLCTCKESYCHMVYHNGTDETTNGINNNFNIEETTTLTNSNMDVTVVSHNKNTADAITTKVQKKVTVKKPKNFKLKVKKRSIIINYKKRKQKDKVIIYISKRKKFKTIKKITTENNRVKYKAKKKGYYYVKIRALRIIDKKNTIANIAESNE